MALTPSVADIVRHYLDLHGAGRRLDEIGTLLKEQTGSGSGTGLSAWAKGLRRPRPDHVHALRRILGCQCFEFNDDAIRHAFGSTTRGRGQVGSTASSEVGSSVVVDAFGRRPKRILVMATEWFSVHGGLSTLNRRLCEALAAVGADVYCLVLDASEQERRAAAACGVELITATRLIGSGEQEALSRRPILPQGVVPDLIIGHGRITGRAAAVVAHDHFDHAPRLHILHMAPDETEWLKLDRKDDAGLTAQERVSEERALLRPPAVSAGVGPRLYDLAQAEQAAFRGGPEPLRIDPGFDGRVEPRTPPRGRPVRVLLLGRLEYRMVKGLDLAAWALSGAIDLLGLDPSRVELVLRGVPVGQFSDVREAVQGWAGKRSLRVAPRSYTVDSEEIREDLLRATLVLMPSRAEGFGLVGVEAIVAGTPVLVSDASGLGDLLREVLPDEEAARVVVPVTGDDGEDARRWAAAVAAVLKDPTAAFVTAERVRSLMAKECTWAGAAESVLRAIS